MKKKMFGYIYKTTNLVNNKLYIGKKLGVFNPSYLGSGIALQRAVKKYGVGNFKVKVLCYAKNKKELNELEIKKIKYYKSRYSTYNIAKGGDGGWNWEDKEWRKQLLKKREGCSVGKKNAMYGKPAVNLGIPHSKETRAKLSKAAINRFKDPKQRQWIKLLNKGRKHSDEVNKRKGRSILGKDSSGYKSDYHTPYGVFHTVSEAVLKTKLTIDIIRDCCLKNANKIITERSLRRSLVLTKKDIGKTYRQLGWFFVPMAGGGI